MPSNLLQLDQRIKVRLRTLQWCDYLVSDHPTGNELSGVSACNINDHVFILLIKCAKRLREVIEFSQ
ncbi:Uncharacterised protein [Klebsiella pneumoniae]|uniref:Uncharacterized protein n=1 Tax=Klebsiella pneumoniae TaxID=573 RepID=A0A2X1Q744_KLEPN|nr:Uncharacterised protein [Klebsiella pneumoniae]